MRLPIAVLAAMLGIVSASAQDQVSAIKPVQPATRPDACAPIASLLAAKPTTIGRLFHFDGVWKEIEFNFLPFSTDYTLDHYRGEQLTFIYASPPPPPQGYTGRQFLSVRTIAYNDPSTNFVNLRKRQDRRGSPMVEDQVQFGRYQNYHRDGKPSGILTVFHTWFDGTRSDDPSETRKSWTFDRASGAARRRVLAVTFVPRAGNVTCSRFWLGPNIAAPNDEDDSADGYDLALGPFTIEISEAKTGTGSSGRTFKIQSAPENH